MLSHLARHECVDESLRHKACATGAAWAAQKVKEVGNLVQHGIVISNLVTFLVLVILFCLVTCQVFAVLAVMTHGI